MTAKQTASILVSALAMALAAVVVLLVHIGHPRVVGRAVAPDGTELCVVQECNWGPELFTTSFVYRKPGTEWRRFYYDHEDDYWGSARVTLDTNTEVAVVFRGSSPAVTFRWDPEVYTMHRWDRTLTNAQWQMPPDWTPQRSVYPHR